jgi:hypothetical protein
MRRRGTAPAVDFLVSWRFKPAARTRSADERHTMCYAP